MRRVDCWRTTFGEAPSHIFSPPNTFHNMFIQGTIQGENGDYFHRAVPSDFVLVSIRKLKERLKKKMYRVQIEAAKPQIERIHLERESYTKARECRLFSGATSAVATTAKHIAVRSRVQRARAQTSG